MVEVAAAGEGCPERDGIAQLPCDAFNREAVKIPEVGIRSRQHTDLAAGSHKGSYHRRSDESGGACDEGFHRSVRGEKSGVKGWPKIESNCE
jgi:hypothetical protein